jgi:hypothetical protein
MRFWTALKCATTATLLSVMDAVQPVTRLRFAAMVFRSVARRAMTATVLMEMDAMHFVRIVALCRGVRPDPCVRMPLRTAPAPHKPSLQPQESPVPKLGRPTTASLHFNLARSATLSLEMAVMPPALSGPTAFCRQGWGRRVTMAVSRPAQWVCVVRGVCVVCVVSVVCGECGVCGVWCVWCVVCLVCVVCVVCVVCACVCGVCGVW